MSRRELGKKHIDKKLRTRMLMYFIMSLGVLGFSIYEIIAHQAPWHIMLVAMIVGFGLGLLTHRIFLIYWQEDEQKVISRVDRLGGVILAVYILFSVFRSKIIGFIVSGPAILAVTMALAFGLMFGRVFGMRKRILKILKEQDILE